MTSAKLYQTVPGWMQEGTEFSNLFDTWQRGEMTYMQFARLIQPLPDVPEYTKSQHLHSARMIADGMNRALYVYECLAEADSAYLEALLEKYDPNVKHDVTAPARLDFDL